MMRRLTAGILVGLLATAAAPAFAQAKAKATTPEIPFDSVPNFFKLPPGLYMGEGVGVATNSKGHVFVYVRSGETRCAQEDETDHESSHLFLRSQQPMSAPPCRARVCRHTE